MSQRCYLGQSGPDPIYSAVFSVFAQGSTLYELRVNAPCSLSAFSIGYASAKTQTGLFYSTLYIFLHFPSVSNPSHPHSLTLSQFQLHRSHFSSLPLNFLVSGDFFKISLSVKFFIYTYSLYRFKHLNIKCIVLKCVLRQLPKLLFHK